MNLLTFIFNKEELLTSLNNGWKGYLSLFIAMFLIFITILILNKLSKKKDQ